MAALRRRFSLEDRRKFLELYDQLPKLSLREAAARLNIVPSLLWKLLQKRSMIMKGEIISRKPRVSCGKCPRLEATLWKWIDQIRQNGSPVTDLMIHRKAAAVASRMGMTSFRPSPKWYSSFKKRESLVRERYRIYPKDDHDDHSHHSYNPQDQPYSLKDELKNIQVEPYSLQDESDCVPDQINKVRDHPNKLQNQHCSLQSQPSQLNEPSSHPQDQANKLQNQHCSVQNQPSQLNEPSSHPQDQANKLQNQHCSVQSQPSQLNEPSSDPQDQANKLRNQHCSVQSQPSQLNEPSSHPQDQANNHHGQPNKLEYQSCDIQSQPNKLQDQLFKLQNQLFKLQDQCNKLQDQCRNSQVQPRNESGSVVSLPADPKMHGAVSSTKPEPAIGHPDERGDQVQVISEPTVITNVLDKDMQTITVPSLNQMKEAMRTLATGLLYRGFCDFKLLHQFEKEVAKVVSRSMAQGCQDSFVA